VFGWFDWISALIASVLLALCGVTFGALVGAPLALVIYVV
jgi:ABC-type spermidine/putrescine transport system permease subunit II